MSKKLAYKTFVLFALLISLPNINFAADKKYDESSNIISAPASFSQETLQDIQSLLQKATGKRWTTTNGITKKGIILSLNKLLDYPSIESSRIVSDGRSFTKLEAYGNEGLTFGIYKYLRLLGFKFYLPDENYNIIPRLKSPFLAFNKMITPFQQIRNFFGTGGFGSGKTDTDMSVEKDWQLWEKRNGFGQAFSLAGHVGETFNLANTPTLTKNPSWTSTPIMKNGKVDVGTKLNYLNPAAIDFFTDWVIKKYSAPGYIPPPVYIPDMVSIEPADGGDYMAGTAVVKGTPLNTVSDQVFFAANEAAKKLDKLFPNHPNIGVNLYAYSGHADVPSFPLHKRVFLQLIPYQFQTISFGPAFIKRWAAKTGNFGLYDYLRYADASWDIPKGGTLDEIMKRAVYAHRQGSKGTTYETSYSKFSTGIILWILIRYMADGDANWEKNYQQLINDLFETSAIPVKKIFDAFYRSPSFDKPQLEQSLYYAERAHKKNKYATVGYRLNELDLYLAYINTYFESLDEKKGSLEQRRMSVYNIAWSLYEKKILHSYRIMQLVSYSFLNAKTANKEDSVRYKTLHLQTFPETTDKNAIWKNKPLFSDEKIKTLIKQKSPKFIEEPIPDQKLSIEKQLEIAQNNFSYTKELIFQGNYTARGYFNLYASEKKAITIKWSLQNDKEKDPSLTISGVDKEYKAVYDFPLKGKQGSFTLHISPGATSFFVNTSRYSTFQLSVKLNGTVAFFTPSPRGKMAFLDRNEKNSYDPLYYPSYIYMPKNTKSVTYKVQLNGLKIFLPDGQQVQTTLLSTQPGGFEIRRFSPPANQTGKFWKVLTKGYNYEMLNIPDTYFLLQPKE